MKLQFEINKLDLLKFNEFHYWYSPDRKFYRLKNRLTIAILLLVMPFVFLYTENEIKINNAHLINNLFIGIMLGCVGWSMSKSYFLYIIKKNVTEFLSQGKNQDLIGEHTMIFSIDEIEIITPNTYSKININSIEKIIDDIDCFYIYVNVLSALMIPKNI